MVGSMALPQLDLGLDKWCDAIGADLIEESAPVSLRTSSVFVDFANVGPSFCHAANLLYDLLEVEFLGSVSVLLG